MQVMIDISQSSPETTNVSKMNTTFHAAKDSGTESSGRLAVSQTRSHDIADVAIHLEAVLVISLFVCSLVINCLMFLLFIKKPSLVTMSNRFVLNLGVCNVLNAFSTMPVMFVSLISRKWVFSAPWCQATGFLTSVSFLASSLTLVVISLDRYCAVISPLHYKMKVTPQRSWMLITAVWFLAVLATVPPLFGWNNFGYQPEKFTCTVTWSSHQSRDQYYTLFVFFLGFLFPLVVIIVTYSVIFRAAMNNSARTGRSVPPPPSLTEVTVNPPISKKSLTDSRVSLLSTKQGLAEKTARNVPSHFRRDLFTTARTSFIVIFSFLLCWFPYYMSSLLESFLPEGNPLPVFLLHLSYCLALSSSVITPVVYVFRNRHIRREIERTFFPVPKNAPRLTSVYSRRIVNTEVILSRGTSVEQVTETETPTGKMAFTNDAFILSRCNSV